MWFSILLAMKVTLEPNHAQATINLQHITLVSYVVTIPLSVTIMVSHVQVEPDGYLAQIAS